MKKFVLVVDICSSTSMIENLVSNGSEEKYSLLIQDFLISVKQSGDYSKQEIYKFLGDGFIILFEDTCTPEYVFSYVQELSESMKVVLHEFIGNNIDIELPKKGLTFGLAFGSIHKVEKVFEINEYFGRPINLASRLQSSAEESDTMIVQKEVFSMVKSPIIRNMCIETTRTLKNINNTIRCYIFPTLHQDSILRQKYKNEQQNKQFDGETNIYGQTLSSREYQLFQLLVKNMSIRDMSISLGVTSTYASQLKRSIMNKFKVSTVEELNRIIRKKNA
jgi:DNA-binding CsgD family transcriptional regulator